jgi:glycosyltransferase involved in cell wall biosynthesis
MSSSGRFLPPRKRHYDYKKEEDGTISDPSIGVIYTMARVLAVTEYYNEAEYIPRLVENVALQTCVPKLWLLIDDGSTDNSTEIFIEHLMKRNIPYKHYRMPSKPLPDANLKGIAFQKVDILNNEWLDNDEFDYLVKIDADTQLPSHFIEVCGRVMDEFPEFGITAGRIRGELGHETPMGTGKVVSWNVLKHSANRYWDLDPDSLWNYFAIANGYRMLIIEDLKIEVVRPTVMIRSKGVYNYGRRMYYLNWRMASAVFYSLVLLLRRNFPVQFFKGYLHEFRRRSWRLEDKELVRYYGFRNMFLRLVGRGPKSDRALILKLGLEDTGVETDSIVDSALGSLRSQLKE